MKFPILGEFENPLELNLWRLPEKGLSFGTELELSTAQIRKGEKSLRVCRGNAKTLGMSYYAGDLDWSKYSFLALNIHSPLSDSQVHMRIDDSHDCSNFDSRLIGDWIFGSVGTKSEYRLVKSGAAENRELDLAAIRRMLFFAPNPTLSELYFDEIRLIP